MKDNNSYEIPEQDSMNVEALYQHYLKMTKQNVLNMGVVQRKETKRAFMGAIGMMLQAFFPTISKMNEADAIKALDDMNEQIGTFWNNQKPLACK